MSIELLHEKIEKVCPIHGVCPDKNRIDFKDEANAGQRTAAQAILNAYISNPNTVKTTDEKREEGYEAAGCTKFAMIDALWEKIMNSDSTDADALKAIRDAVDAANPE